MAGVFYLLLTPTLLTPLFTSCSPEKFDGPDQNGIPSISGKDIQVSVDQAVNQATFTVSGMEKGTYPIWVIDGKSYSTLDPTSYSNAKAGTHDIELRLGNRNGFSQGSISKSFKFDNSIVDFSVYVNRIARTWRINYAESGHMGYGEPGTDGSNWWSAEPNVKADWGVYDDRLTFTADGAYTFDPGDGGTVYVNTGASIFAEYNTNDGQDFMAPVETQNTTYKFDVEGEKILLKLPAQTLFPYLSSDDQYNNPVFTVSKLNNSEMVLLYEGNGITWRFVFTSKEDTDAPFTGFKAKSDFNMWRDITPEMSFYYNPDPGWGNEQTTLFASLFEGGNNDYHVTIPQECFSEWQAQVHFHTGLTTSAANHYDFSVVLSTDRDIDGVVVKLTNEDDTEAIIDEHQINLKAGDDYVFWKSDIEGKDLTPVKLVFDFGHATGETHVDIKNIVLKNHADDDGTVLPDPNGNGNGGEEAKVDWDATSGANLWKAVEDESAFISVTPWFADGSWTKIGDPAWTHKDGVWSLTIPEGMGGSQWQGQFPINTTLTASMSKKYNFYLVLESDQDLSGVTIKLTETDDADGTKHDDNFFFADRHDVKADVPFVYKAEGVALPKNDAHALSLFFDFGGSPIGANVKISKIYFEEAVSMDYDDADNLWKAVDDGSKFDSYFYYMADKSWSPISYTDVSHSGNAYELVLPEGLGDSQWQGQFAICTKLTASAAKQYNFQLVMETDQDCPQVTIKLTDSGDTNFFCEGRHDIPAGEPFVFTLKGATLKEGTDASAIRLFFDFGGSPAGAHVKISKIVFKEAQ